MTSPLHHEPNTPRWQSWLLPCIYVALAVGAFAVFTGVLRNGFLIYDDATYIFDNPWVNKGLTYESFKFAWRGPHGGHWHPLTTLSHVMDCEIFGVKHPAFHHLVSLCLHTVSVLLLFEALRRMTAEVWPSALVAALFAIHPLRVESVAWAAERKDVLSGCFFMLTLLAYGWYTKRPGILRYLVVSIAYCLGLLSKPTLVTLPCVLLLLDWWPLARWRPRTFQWVPANRSSRFPQCNIAHLVLEKLPWLAVAGFFSAMTVQASELAMSSREQLSISWRLVNAPLAIVFYLRKTIWHLDLAVLYPHPGLVPGGRLNDWVLPAFGALCLLTAVTIYAGCSAGRRPYLIVGWLWYLGTLVPMIGLVQVGVHAYADRYGYLPLIGVYMGIAWAVRDLLQRWPRAARPLWSLGAVWLLLLMAATWRQVALWRDDERLLTHSLRVTGDNPYLHNILGNSLLNRGQVSRAVHHSREAVRLHPDFAEAHASLGAALHKSGQTDEALTHLQQAVQLKPGLALAHVDLAHALVGAGRPEEALAHAGEAVRLSPSSAVAQNNLGFVLGSQGQTRQAVEHFHTALRLKPEYALALNNLGFALLNLGQTDEAIFHFNQAVQLEPDLALARINLGNVLEQQGRLQEAAAQFRAALEKEPANMDVLRRIRRIEAQLAQP